MASKRLAFRLLGIAGLAVALACVAGQASAADPNLAVNGSFATTSKTSAEFGSINNGYTPTVQLTGWSTSGYNFVYLPNTVDTYGAIGQYTSTATLASPGMRMWGPNDNGGLANGLVQASPTGGNFIAADGAYEISAITQTIAGMNVGAKVYVSFAWAGAQQYSFTGPTTDRWTVDLGSSPSQTTQAVSLVSNGASAWMTQTFSFIATSSSELLSFLATGTPSGQPPFALLSNVVVTAPEPQSVALLLSGTIGLMVAARRRRPRAATKVSA